MNELQRAAQERRNAAERGDLRALRKQTPCFEGTWQARAADAARSVPFQATEIRGQMERRTSDSADMYHLTGIASVTDKPYRMWDFFGEYEEIVARDAFMDTLASGPDVAFLVNHKGVTMARTTNGNLALEMRDTGLGMDAWLNPKRHDVADLMHAIEDRDIDQMSFAFMLDEGWWNDDFTQFKITNLDLDRGDVSAVNYGANPYTSIAARSRDLFEDLDRLPVGIARAAARQLAARPDMPEPAPAAAPEAAPAPSGGDVSFYEALLSTD